ncbi:MAG: hypothetical protein EA412_05115 [Chitinophagaceae bacterium]|nr:MAG: hypothetical protein EA412_05115 [Chitinophagaceae bacterium]
MQFPEDKKFFNFFLDGQKLLIREDLQSPRSLSEIDFNMDKDTKVIIFVKIDDILLDSEMLSFIEKIMNSVQLENKNYFVINLKKYPDIQFSSFRRKFPDPKVFIFFGVQTLELALNISMGEGLMMKFKDYTFIKSLSPEVLKNDKQAKNKLWTNLKNTFYNEG